jgi:hypothetical protein
MSRSYIIILSLLFFAFVSFSIGTHLLSGNLPIKEKPVHPSFSIAKPDARIPENNSRVFVLCFNCIFLEIKKPFESESAKTPQLYTNFGAAKIPVFLHFRYFSLLGYHLKERIPSSFDTEPLVA